jgi:hypothetical protein
MDSNLCCEPVTQAKMRFFARRIQILKKTSQNLVTIHKRTPLSPAPMLTHAASCGGVGCNAEAFEFTTQNRRRSLNCEGGLGPRAVTCARRCRPAPTPLLQGKASMGALICQKQFSLDTFV